MHEILKCFVYYILKYFLLLYNEIAYVPLDICVYAHVYVCTCVCMCMYVYVYVCMYACMCVYLYMYVYLYRCIFVCVYIYACISMHMCICMCMYVCVSMCICVYVCMCACMFCCVIEYIYMYAYLNVHAWVCMYVWVYVYACICLYRYECMHVLMCVYVYVYDCLYFCIHIYGWFYFSKNYGFFSFFLNFLNENFQHCTNVKRSKCTLLLPPFFQSICEIIHFVIFTMLICLIGKCIIWLIYGKFGSVLFALWFWKNKLELTKYSFCLWTCIYEEASLKGIIALADKIRQQGNHWSSG